MKKVILLAAFLSLSFGAFSQFTLSAEFRPRFEFRDSYKLLPPSLGQTPAYQISQRTRLNVGFKWSIINTYLSIQDVRLWGDEAIKKDVAGLNLYQGWAEIKVCDSFFVKAGRQEFIYDNERLFTHSNWTQKGITHDALLLKYNHRGFSADMAMAFNQSRDTTNSTDYSTTLGNYKALTFLWLKYNIKKHFAVQATMIADGYQKKGTSNTTYVRVTNGGIFNFKSKFVHVDARGFYQWGHDETGLQIEAYYANVDVTLKPKNWLSVFTGCEYMSGNDLSNTTNKKMNAFNILYGSGHKFNGNIDFFCKPTDTKNTGLVDIYLDFFFLLKKQYQLRADFHYFRTQNNYTVGTTLQNPYLASEADISAKIPIVKDVDVQLGYSAIMGSNTLMQMQGGNKKSFSHWAFVMLTIKPTLFTWEGKK
ncbi:MAG: alginate export family protein [Bacteroidota bacterium]